MSLYVIDITIAGKTPTEVEIIIQRGDKSAR